MIKFWLNVCIKYSFFTSSLRCLLTFNLWASYFINEMSRENVFQFYVVDPMVKVRVLCSFSQLQSFKDRISLFLPKAQYHVQIFNDHKTLVLVGIYKHVFSVSAVY